MMRKLIWLGALLALAACDENSGWNPNYVVADRPYGSVFDSTSSYARYKYTRERALMGLEPMPAIIPRTRPVSAPAPEAIRPHGAQPDGSKAVSGAPKRPEAWRKAATAQAGRAAAGATAATASDPATRLARYAQSVNHPPGTTVWPRMNADPTIAARACADHPNANDAQLAFLAKGGPAEDPARMDPDGDGFVCGWNPAPWRAAARR